MSSWKGGDWDLAWAWDGMGDGSYPPTREDKKNKNKKNLKKNYFKIHENKKQQIHKNTNKRRSILHVYILC